jgi:hypothetical protein
MVKLLRTSDHVADSTVKAIAVTNNCIHVAPQRRVTKKF